MLLYCVRHGESAFNAEGRIQGQTDVSLSPLGLQQSQALATALSKLPIEAVFSSPLARAAQTARPVADALGLELIFEPGLKELNAGVFQGRTWDEVRIEHPEASARWKSGDPDFVIPGGESRRQLMHRGRQALESIRERGFRHVAVIAHGGVLSAAFKSLLGIPAELNPFNLFNASISQLAWDNQIKLLTLNQVDHLPRLEGVHATRTGDL
jgi:2,3-bisphosphoglycerate-dependent phosphoglycerate mutase